MSKARNIKKNVFPGEELAVIEEYNKGEGSYQEDGLVRSEELGETRLNKEKRALEVKKVTKTLNLPLEGVVVIAEAGSVTRRDARVDIFRVAGKKIAAHLHRCHPHKRRRTRVRQEPGAGPPEW